MDKDYSKVVKSITKNLLTRLDVGPDQIKVTPGKDSDYLIDVSVPEPESAVIIGYHGETISSLQLILSLIFQNQVKSWHRLTLDINGYRHKRSQDLEGVAKEAAERAKTSGEEVVMPAMGSFDRRLIHITLAQDPSIKTESVGEGKDRRLIIYPVSQKSSKTQ